MIYVVVKEGVYIQEVYGSCDAVDDAKVLAERLAGEELDDYHTFGVYPLDHSGLGEKVEVFRGEKKNNMTPKDLKAEDEFLEAQAKAIREYLEKLKKKE